MTGYEDIIECVVFLVQFLSRKNEFFLRTGYDGLLLKVYFPILDAVLNIILFLVY